MQTSPVKLEVQSVPHPQPAAERCCLFVLVGPAAPACLCLPPRTLSRASVPHPCHPGRPSSPEASPRPEGPKSSQGPAGFSLGAQTPESVQTHSDIVPSGTWDCRSCSTGLGVESVKAGEVRESNLGCPFIHSFIHSSFIQFTELPFCQETLSETRSW